MDKLSKNIKTVLVIWLMIFIGAITYLSYFIVFRSTEISNDPSNKRLWAERNAVLRGTIYDKNMVALTTSEREGLLTQKRGYVYPEAFAHIIGYSNEKYGITGLEKLYDRDLMANYQYTLFDKIITKKDENKEKIGNSIVLNLDYNLQKFAYEKLEGYIGSIVAMNPKTGEILASVSTPSFDANYLTENFNDIVENKSYPLLNRVSQGLYAPGSTFKIVTATSALENFNGITNETFEDNGELYLNENNSIYNSGKIANGNIDLKTAFAKSSNVVFGNIALRLENNKLKKTAEEFLFNKNIPSDGYLIEDSIFPQLDGSSKGDIAQSGIGQSSILATPMQILILSSAIANDGIIMKPTVVNRVINKDGDLVRTNSNEEIGRATSITNANILKEYMRQVVISGTGKIANNSDIQIAGKTGTAEHVESKKDNIWFTGFAPYENPEIAVCVMIEEGVDSSITTRIAKEILETYLIN